MDILRRNTDYALRLAVNLAKHHGDGAVATRVLAEDEDVSYQLACKLMQKMSKAGLVQSDMGPKGGFRLGRSPEEIAILDVIEAVQGPLRLNRCLLNDDVCSRQAVCPVRAKMKELQEQMDQYLGGVTLGELARTRMPCRKKAKQAGRQL